MTLPTAPGRETDLGRQPLPQHDGRYHNCGSRAVDDDQVRYDIPRPTPGFTNVPTGDFTQVLEEAQWLLHGMGVSGRFCLLVCLAHCERVGTFHNVLLF